MLPSSSPAVGIVALLLLTSTRVRRQQTAGEEVQEAEGGRGPGPPAEVVHEQPLHAQKIGKLHSGRRGELRF